MQVRCGDIVKMRDGRVVSVTDAAYEEPELYILSDEDEIIEFNPETVFVGETPTGRTVVSDMSEVVCILN